MEYFLIILLQHFLIKFCLIMLRYLNFCLIFFFYCINDENLQLLTKKYTYVHPICIQFFMLYLFFDLK